VSGHIDQRALNRRIIAIAAACIIALSTAITSFAAARVDAEALVDPLGVICHTEDTGAPPRSRDDGNARRCIDSCSVCCLMHTTLPPHPPVFYRTALPIPAGLPFAAPLLAGRFDSKSHRSRAPPQSA
jgi:hypothetical protein